jgi:predicted lipid-binding transport protein (Tim44 family)
MRTPRTAAVGRSTAVLCLTALLLLGACGGRPTPQAWAAAVCSALAPWRAEIGTLTRSTQQQMTAQTTPAQAQENLVRLLRGAEAASETARRKVEAAGVPDTEKGEAISRGFLASLTAYRDAYGRASAAIEGLDTSRPAEFYQGVRAAIDTLNKEYDDSSLDTSELDSVELQQAFDEVPECR